MDIWVNHVRGWERVNQTKMWYESSTMWINIVGLCVLVLEYSVDIMWISSDVVAPILALLNMWLRLQNGTVDIKRKLK